LRFRDHRAAGSDITCVFERTVSPQSTIVGPAAAALAVGATLGLIVSITLLSMGKMKRSSPRGRRCLEIEREKKKASKSTDREAKREEREWTP